MLKKGQKLTKRLNVEHLEVGKRYYTEIGIWKSVTTYCGCENVKGRTLYHFTYGNAENSKNQVGHYCTKTQVKVYGITEKEREKNVQ